MPAAVLAACAMGVNFTAANSRLMPALDDELEDCWS
jgi:hypothetical protein